MTTLKNYNSLIINELKATTPPLFGKRPYTSPTSKVMRFDAITMASTTVQVQTNTSSEEDWNTETTVTGGEMEL